MVVFIGIVVTVGNMGGGLSIANFRYNSETQIGTGK